jgi:hypothetical protein
MCAAFSEELNKRVADRVDNPKRTSDGQYVRYAEMVMRQTVWNYRKEEAGPFLRVAMLWPQHVTTAKGCLEQVSEWRLFGLCESHTCTTLHIHACMDSLGIV